MRGLGGCRFERANEAWNFTGGDFWNTAFAATWEKGQPLADAGHRQLHRPPRGNVPLGLLHRQLAASAPKTPKPRSSRRTLPLKPSFCPLSIMFTDWNRSGHAVAPRLQRPRILQGRPGADVEDRAGRKPELYTQAEGWKYLRIWGMGIASYDVELRHLPDYFLTSMADNKLQTVLARTCRRRKAEALLCRHRLRRA
jgi:hypothetical protein